MSAGSLYFIQVGEDGPVKIGYSVNPASRLVSLQSAHFERLHLIGLTPGTRQAEENLHAKLARFALGHEWYAATAEIFAEIEEPVARVHVTLDAAVIAREHLGRAIALLRGSDRERGAEELRCVLTLLTEALQREEVAA